MSKADAEKRRKQINSLRYRWHERVLRDRVVRKHPNALALAGYVMHRFHPELGYAEFSIDVAAAALDAEPRSIVRARLFLVNRNWIVLKERRTDQRRGWAANRYTLGGGPEDLVLEEHGATDADDTVTDDSGDVPT